MEKEPHNYCCYPFFIPLKNQEKNRKKIQKYRRIHMKKAQKIAQVGGEGPKWQVKKLDD